MTDLINHQVQIFPGINDVPRAPTNQRAGNASDLIKRFNSLIENTSYLIAAIRADLDLLTSAPDAGIVNWMITLSNNPDIIRLDVHYVNISEKKFYDSALIDVDDPVLSVEIGQAVAPGSTVNISPTIQQYGPGFYFFVYAMNDESLKEDTNVGEYLSAVPNGMARAIDGYKSIQIFYSDRPGATIQANRGLAVIQTMGSASFTVADSEVIIG